MNAETGTKKGASARLGAGLGLALDERGRVLWFTGVDHHKIKRLDLRTGLVTTVAGNGNGNGEEDGQDGVGDAVRLSEPMRPAIDGDGTKLHFADYGNHKIKCLDV